MSIPFVGLSSIGIIGFFDTVYPIDNESLSLLAIDRGLVPAYTDSDYNERDYVSRLVVDYDRERYRHRVTRIRPDEPETLEEIVAPRDVYDDISMIYDVRSRDLTPGNAFVYYTHDGDEFARITIGVTGSEQVFTEPFGYVDCDVLSWVVEPLETAPILPFGGVDLPPAYRSAGDPEEIAVSYFSDDDRRLLVGTDIQTSIGLMTIRVIDYRPPTRASSQAVDP